MAGEKVDFDKATEATQTGGARKNERSAIGFPYLDIDTAVEVANAVRETSGLGVCQLDELAKTMGQVVSGAFRLKTSTARMFGFTEKGDQSGIKLTELGEQVTETGTEPEARAEAFLNIPLYSALYETYRGKLLPPAKALEREMINLGVAPKQAEKARQIFERSSRQSGFNDGDGRLVRPRTDHVPTPESRPMEKTAAIDVPRGGGGGNGGGGSGGAKPLKYQLIDLLDPGVMDEDEQKAVWTLINYLARIESGAKRKTAGDNEPPAA